nr:hypothetical protein [uncultured Albidiferax sp.]
MKYRTVLGLVALLGYFQPALAQVALPTVTKIQDFFTQAVAEIDAGVQPRLVSLGTPASRKLLAQALKVRIFSLNANKDRPEPSGDERGNCEVFISSTYPVRVVGNTLELMPTSYAWLGGSSIEKTILSGRYWVVLESATDSKDDLLLLDRNQKEAYFNSGMLLVIKPTAEPAKEQIMEAFRVRRQKLEATELEIRKKIGGMTCYGFKKLVADGDTDHVEEIVACTTTASEGSS